MKNVKIKLFAQQTMAVCVKYVTYSRHKNLEKMEKILALCIQNLFTPVSFKTYIRRKTRFTSTCIVILQKYLNIAGSTRRVGDFDHER